jgi:hypothetical protein
MRKKVAQVLISTFAVSFICAGQTPRPHQNLATVKIVAYDTRGMRLGAPNVLNFESESHEDLAAKFHKGLAENIPFGVYRIKAQLPAYFSEVRYVRVYQDRVTAIVGLNLGNELPIMPASLHGRIIGTAGAGFKGTFVKLSGIFANTSLESEIGPNGEFEMSGVTDGVYMLLIASEQGVLASKAITVPYAGLLEINLGISPK